MGRKKDLRQIYRLILQNLSQVNPDITKELEYYRNLDCKDWNDRDFFEVLTRTVFTGIREEIIESKWSAITSAFSDFDFNKVAKFSAEDLMNNPDIIRHRGRIEATIANAKKMKEIVKEYGSFLNYINSFEKPDELISNLQRQFDFIGDINVYEALKEFGMPYIKPERQIKKVFLRLGLISEKASEDEIIKVGKAIAKAVNERPCVVDWVFWSFGSKVCKKKPDCRKCWLTHLCQRGLNPYVSA